MPKTDTLTLDTTTPAPSANYNPASTASRQELAGRLIAMLDGAGFTELPKARQGSERVYMRPHASDDRVQIRVYTSVIDASTRKVGWSFRSTPLAKPEVRKAGKDAIRVAIVWADENGTRGLGSDKRVNRNGKSTVYEISDRVLDRMRRQYGKVKELDRCKCCGAPLFTSKVRKDATGKVIGGGNLVCAALCFKHRPAAPKAAPAAPKAAPAAKGDYSRFAGVEVPSWL